MLPSVPFSVCVRCGEVLETPGYSGTFACPRCGWNFVVQAPEVAGPVTINVHTYRKPQTKMPKGVGCLAEVLAIAIALFLLLIFFRVLLTPAQPLPDIYETPIVIEETESGKGIRIRREKK